MKRQVSPLLAIVSVLVVLGLTYVAWYAIAGNPQGSMVGSKLPGVPGAVTKSLQKAVGPPGGENRTAPVKMGSGGDAQSSSSPNADQNGAR